MGFLIRKPRKRIALYLFLNIIFVVIIFGLFIDMFDLTSYIFNIKVGNVLGIIVNIMALISIRYIRFIEVGYITSKVQIFCSKNKFHKALKLLKRKMNNFPKKFDPNWLSIKSMVLIKMGKIEEAETILNYLLSQYPNFQSALYYKSCLESLKGNRMYSINNLKRLLMIYKRTEKKTNNPITRIIIKKWRKNLLDLLLVDEDLENIRDTTKFNKFIKNISR